MVGHASGLQIIAKARSWGATDAAKPRHSNLRQRKLRRVPGESQKGHFLIPYSWKERHLPKHYSPMLIVFGVVSICFLLSNRLNKLLLHLHFPANAGAPEAVGGRPGCTIIRKAFGRAHGGANPRDPGVCSLSVGSNHDAHPNNVLECLRYLEFLVSNQPIQTWHVLSLWCANCPL